MSSYPSTIRNQKSFSESVVSITCPHCENRFPFDGVCDWSWLLKCFGNTGISPMDFDGVIERNGRYLILETKDVGIPIPKGQHITLHNLKCPESFTVLKIWGKQRPVKMIVCYPNGKEKTITDLSEMQDAVARWFRWANRKGTIKANGSISLIKTKDHKITNQYKLPLK